MSAIPTNAEALLTRKEVASALSEAGYRISASTIATRVANGQPNPPFKVFGRRALYRWSEALAWAQSQCIEPTRRAA